MPTNDTTADPGGQSPPGNDAEDTRVSSGGQDASATERLAAALLAARLACVGAGLRDAREHIDAAIEDVDHASRERASEHCAGDVIDFIDNVRGFAGRVQPAVWHEFAGAALVMAEGYADVDRDCRYNPWTGPPVYSRVDVERMVAEAKREGSSR